MTPGPTPVPAADGPALDVRPLTPDRWDALAELFGANGAAAGCWCMWWRLTAGEWRQGAGDGNRTALRALVDAGRVPGLLAFVGERPAGWCSFGPRAVFPRFERSRITRPVDDQPVWSIVCFFVHRHFRRRGMAATLLAATAAYAAAQGAGILEAYPVDTGGKRMRDDALWTGLAAMYRAAGFQEVARRSPTRPIMRRYL
jgi:GNAT superfamily N-acetyltransferase